MSDRLYYHSTCPLCQQNVDLWQTDHYRVLPLDDKKAGILNKKPVYSKNGLIEVDGHRIGWDIQYPKLSCMAKTWVFHTRCVSFVNHLPRQTLYQLLDLVEPTVLHPPSTPSSQHGAFNAQPGIGVGTGDSVRAPASVPADIWDMVLQYDVGRLLFVMKTASQLTGSGTLSRSPPSSFSKREKRQMPRFTISTLDLTGPVVQIHLISIGGRPYISDISNTVRGSGTHDNKKLFDLRERKYFAIKSDGVGVVDIASEQQQDGQPKWVLKHFTHPFNMEVCQIRDANFIGLHIIQDSLKCRAIVPSNKQGPSPYFHEEPLPPDDCWVNSGFLVKSILIELEDPSIYFAHATYIPFATMKRIDIKYLPPITIMDITVNDNGSKKSPIDLSVTFDKPPTEVKFLVCQGRLPPMPVSHFLFIQFKIDGQWVPSLDRCSHVDREIVVKNAVGIWMAKTFAYQPMNIGVVTSQPMDPEELSVR